jgi:hypothetical protein
MEKCKKEILYETFNYFASYDFLNKNDIAFILNNVDMLIDYYYMIQNDYILFLPKSYFNISKIVPYSLFCFTKNAQSDIKLKDALEEYNITLIQSEKINEFNYLLQLINRFHKNYSNNDFIENYVMKIGELLYKENKKVKYYLLTHYKCKEYYFYENLYLPYTLYKKIQLSKIVQFISLEHYAYKKNEYMLRSFSQVAEELGATKIHISYNYIKDDEKIMKLGILNKSLINKKSNKHDNNIEFDFTYSENNYINLNEFLLNGKILNENKFLLSKEDYESNIELKYLINARCRNFIEKYYTQFKSSTINNKELNIFLTLKDFNINIENQNIISETIETNLQIDFLNLLNHMNLVDGGNIYPLKEGYIYLKQIISQENIFIKYINFLKAHLHAIQNKYVYLAYNYEYIDNVMKIYHQCIELNFTESELNICVQNYWNNQSEWYHFTLLRDIILVGNDNNNDKLHFITFQYMNIFKNKYNILKKIEKYLYNIIDNVIENQITESINNYINDGYSSEEEIKREQEKLLNKKKKIEKNKANETKVKENETKIEENETKVKENETKIEENTENVEKVEENETKIGENDIILINKIQNFINNNKNSLINNLMSINDYITNIKNKLNSYSYLEDNIEISEIEQNDFINLYLKYIQYIKTSKIKNNVGESFINRSNKYDFDNNNFKQKLKNNLFQKKVIDIVIKGIKGSFYYEDGLSNNIKNIDKLNKSIENVINYYFSDELFLLQDLLLHDMFNAEKYKIIDIHKFIKELIKLLSKYYISNFNNINEKNKENKNETNKLNNKRESTIHDSIQRHMDNNSSPLIINNNKEEISILDETLNIFIKFIYKEIPKEEISEHDLKELINKNFSLNYLLTNYRKHRLFYSYDDYKKIIILLKKNIKNDLYNIKEIKEIKEIKDIKEI